ncbi:MAG: glycoside hydrolase family 88 protein [Clostridia bacterium]|nr:glycoside hydrolase family 88 protein [Clostridia bacterium]
MQVMNEAVFRFLNRKPAKWTFSGGIILNGLIAMFHASGKEEYRRYALDFMEKSVSPEGVILPTPACTADLAACGKGLFFALDETGETRYKMALDAVADRIKAEALPDTPAELYAVMPFLTEYDTRFGGKQAYKAIVHQFRAVHKTLFDAEKGLYFGKDGRFSILDEGFMLMALADTAENLDMQIYEHYRTLSDMLFDAVRLPYRLETDHLFSLSCGDPEQATDPSGGFMIVYVMLKGVRLQMLDAEKYSFLAYRLASDLMACRKDVPEACDPGVGLLAQAEINVKEVQQP